MMVTPYFLSMPSTEAITTEAQSVKGIKPILTSFFSGASEPWAYTTARRAGLMPTAPTAAACSTLRRDTVGLRSSVIQGLLDKLKNTMQKTKKAFDLCSHVMRECRVRTPLFFQSLTSSLK